MQIKGFNLTGQYTTRTTIEQDPVHMLYFCLPSQAVIAVCRSRFKKQADPWYILYGFCPNKGTAISKYSKYPTFEAACEGVLERFRDQNPQVLVNNHLAEYTGALFGSHYWSNLNEDGSIGDDTEYHALGIRGKFRSWWDVKPNQVPSPVEGMDPNEAVDAYRRMLTEYKTDLEHETNVFWENCERAIGYYRHWYEPDNMVLFMPEVPDPNADYSQYRKNQREWELNRLHELEQRR